MFVKVIGDASKKEYKISVLKDDLELSLLLFLTKNGLPIASSCSGKNVCKKCVVNEQVLSCSLTVKDFINKHNTNIRISYL